jgi:hypothetical protein
MASTVFQTVLSGVLVLVLGQIFMKLVIEPVHQLKKTRADIAHTLIRYAHALHNPKVIPEDLFRETYDKLRMLSGQLYADMELITAYWLFRFLFCLPKTSKVYEGAKNLLAIANWMGIENTKQIDLHIIRNIQELCDNLGLYIAPEDRIDEDLLRKLINR